MAVKNFNKIACLLLSLVLVFSLLSISVFATDAADTVADTVVDTETPDTDAPDATDGTDVVDDGSDAAPAETGDETADDTADTTAETEEVEDTEDTTEESKKISTGTIVSVAITLVIVVVGAVYCIKNREKVAKFFRECKSELKKITWTPKNQVAKNTLVVIVVVLAAAIFVAILDLLFSTGIGLLG